MHDHNHGDGFACVRVFFDLCREPSVRPFVSDDLLEMVSSPKQGPTGEWGIRAEAFEGIMRALVAAKLSGTLPVRLWEPARKARLYVEDIERRGGLKAILHQAFAEPPEAPRPIESRD